jgi:hypothetical protein
MEDTTMLYRKPEVMKSVNAMDAIQSLGSKVKDVADNINGGTEEATPSAYESDE